MPKLCRYISIIIFVINLLILSATNTYASIGSCEGWVSPTNISSNSTSNLVFTVADISNQGSINYVKFNAPSSSFTINSGEPSGGWTASGSGASIVFTGGTISVGTGGTFTISVTTNSDQTQGSWGIEVSESSDGSNAVTCGGSNKSVAIGDSGADVNPPEVVGNISVTGTSGSSVSLSFTTNENSSLRIDYGLSDSYGSNSIVSTYTTSHSITLSSLSSNSTYHFKLTLSDIWGNSQETTDSTFSIASGTTTTTVTNTVTNTSTVTKYVQQVDQEKPTITVSQLEKVYSSSPMIEGVVKDDTAVSKIYYSVDNGKSWIVLENLLGLGTKSVKFKFRPNIVDDGNYQFKLKAIDANNNIFITKSIKIIIDKMPPSLGGFTLKSGPITIDAYSTPVYLPQNINIKSLFYLAGGVTEAYLSWDDKEVKLTSNEDNLWFGIIKFESSGLKDITLTAIDGGENKLKVKVFSANVLQSGKIIFDAKETDATIKVFTYSSELDKYIFWQGKYFDQQNPILVDEEGGNYSLFLPAGKYFLEITASGYKKIRTDIFESDKAVIVNDTINMTKYKNIFHFLNPFADRFKINLPSSLVGDSYGQELIGQEIHQFLINDIDGNPLRGRNSLVTFVTGKLPQTYAQLSRIEKYISENKGINALIVGVYDNQGNLDFLKKKGNYSLNFIADPDGNMANEFKFSNLPFSLFLDNKGKIVKVVSGYLNDDDFTYR